MWWARSSARRGLATLCCGAARVPNFECANAQPAVLSASRHVSTRPRARSSRGAAAVLSAPVSRLQYDASKAGLQKVDVAHVQRVIVEMSSGSKFYTHEQRQGAVRTLQNKTLAVRADQYERHATPQARRISRAKADALIEQLEAGRDLSRRFVHIDMDMFYAACEEKRNPALREVPFAVGSMSMLSTSNYIARQYGVRSGMPGFIAKRLCPALRLVPMHFAVYEEEAQRVRDIAARYDPRFVTLGLDDLTLEVTGYLQRHPSQTTAQVCEQFRREVHDETQLTCSGGIAPTPAFAKMASGKNKPNGQHEIALRSAQEAIDYMSHVPVRDVFGIGAVQQAALASIGVHVCADFLHKKELVAYLYTSNRASFYLAAGLGTMQTHVERILKEDATCRAMRVPAASASAVVPAAASLPQGRAAAPRSEAKGSHTASCARAGSCAATEELPGEARTGHAAAGGALRVRKSVSKAQTLSRRLPSASAFLAKLEQLAAQAHAVLAHEGLQARTVCVGLVSRDFASTQRQHTLPAATSDSALLLAEVRALASPFTNDYRDFRCLTAGFTQLSRATTASAGTAAVTAECRPTSAASSTAHRAKRALPTTKRRAAHAKKLSAASESV